MRLAHPHLDDIYFASVTPINVASSQIRDMIRDGISIKDFVPPTVADYIHQKRLFNDK
jgi:nicotinic acid mononucleotide adenylyltransferase